MTRKQLMEVTYNNIGPGCSSGDLALALSRRFPQLQGNRHLADGTETKSHYEQATEFLIQKRKDKEKERFEKTKNWFEFKVKCNQFADEIAQDIGKEFRRMCYENIGTKVPKYLQAQHHHQH